MAKDPAIDGAVVDLKAALPKHLFQIAVAHPWSLSAFLRIAGSLAQSVERGDSARAVDRLAKCLYNATIEIGGTRTPIATRQQIYDLFNILARAPRRCRSVTSTIPCTQASD